jgi:cytochrome c-type biogenesis protein CcmF
MIGVASACLVLALLVALYGGGAALYGGARGDRRWVDSSRRAVYAMCGLLTICVIILEAAFLRSDFSVELVADHSSTTTPTFYKLTAMWSSQAGSLLLWAWVLSIASSVVLYLTRRRHPELVPWATATLMGIGSFFVALMLFGAHPFSRLSPVPAEGAGLNPLLRHPSMMIHPPMLYSGYVMFSIPFAFAIGALVARRVDASWIRSTRLFALVAWTFLSIGILLGARWSYTELGWGGYWAWDPVENASLMPWLVGTAFLHSIQVQEKRGMLRVWNVTLIVATFSLALLGTFLVRSGVLQSIHAFGASTVGAPILGLIAVVLVGSTALIVSRLDILRSERRIDSLLSREAMFVVNNLLLVGLCAVIFWGTFFPLISEAVTGTRSSLASPWFDRYTTPLAIALVLFAGIGPLVAWRRLSWVAARRTFLWPGLATVAAATVLVAVTDAAGEPWALALFCLAAFTMAALAQEFARAGAARRALAGGSAPAALLGAVSRNRRRYGGYVVHTGIAVLLVGIAASSSFQTNRDLRLGVGETARVNDFDIRYVRPTVDVQNERISFGAMLDVRRDGKRFATLHPSRNYYRGNDPSAGPIGRFFEGESTSEVGLRAGAGRDLWTAMQPDLSALEPRISEADRRFGAAGLDVQGLAIVAIARGYANDPPPATFRVIVNPMVSWMWIGALIALSGALLGLWPSRRGRLKLAAAPGLSVRFDAPANGDPRAADLEARKEAKYREIRDAQMDRAAGKLSEEDFRRQNGELRREAVEILRELDGLEGRRSHGPAERSL